MPKGVYEHTHLVKKTYPLEMVEFVKAHYESGETQDEIAELLNVTQRVVWRLMLNHNIPKRPRVKRDQRGSKNSSWVGDKGIYATFHVRVAVERGKPKLCSGCNKNDPDTRYEWANLTGAYHDTTDYIRLCVPCHKQMDSQRRKETGARTVSVNRKKVMPND